VLDYRSVAQGGDSNERSGRMRWWTSDNPGRDSRRQTRRSVRSAKHNVSVGMWSVALIGMALTGVSPLANASTTSAPFTSASSPRAAKAAASAAMARSKAVDATNAVTITFSEFPVGTTVTNQYEPDGIVFAGNTASDAQTIATDVDNPDSPELSGTPRFTGAVGAHFVVPDTTTPLTVSSFSLDVGYIDDAGSTVVDAYNRAGGLITSVPANQIGWNDITVTDPGIARFVVESVSYEDQGFGVDNVSFSPPNQYAALGDSYASGEGAFSYQASSDTKTNQCHRAKAGYAEGLASQLGLVPGLRFAACSGDVIADLFAKNTTVAARYEPEKTQVTPNGGDVDEPAQVSVLNSRTRVVTLSIGGNDSGFVPVVTDCISGLGAPGAFGCAARDKDAVNRNLSFLVTGRPSRCVAWLPGGRPSVKSWEFCQAEPSLESVYEDIAVDAPNSAIYVVGYPRLFGSTLTKGVCHVDSLTPAIHYSIDGGDVRWINAETADMDTIIKNSVAGAAAVTGREIHFVDPTTAFAGHGLCDTGKAWINKLILKPFKGPIKQATFGPINESFHPTLIGQAEFEKVILAAIAKYGQ
jgi:hypothetical protein